MIGELQPRRTVVRRARARDSRSRARLAVADLGGAGLPPAAILLVRALHAAPPPARPVVWERALADRLEAIARRAWRPAAGTPPADCGAVLFADRAELLACLAVDCADGVAWSRWWWRALAPRGDVQRLLRAAWRDSPEHVPAALSRLAARRRARAAVHALGERDAAVVLRAVSATFGLPGGEAAAADEHPPAVHAPRSGRQAAVAAADPEAVLRPLELGPAGRRLLALAVAPTPVTARSESLAPDSRPPVPATIAARRSSGAPVSRPAEPAQEGAPATEVRADGAPTGKPPARPWAPRRLRAPAAPSTPAPPIGGAALDGPTTSGPPPHAAAQPRAARRPAVAATAASDHPPPAPLAPPAARRSSPDRAESPAPGAPPEPANESPRASRLFRAPHGTLPAVSSTIPQPMPQGVDLPSATSATPTHLGGLFFLVNLALALGLYGDFTQPARPGLSLSPWDLLHLLGERLAPDGADDDPVWSLLGALAGRAPGEPPGLRFAPPPWALPPGWLAAWPGESPERGAGGRLRHSAGFLVAAPGRVTGARDPVGLWAARLAVYVRARLARALELPAPAATACLIERPARVHVSGASVDVVMALADHPVAIRCSGLDRDPGFLPAAGRALAFHFL